MSLRCVHDGDASDAINKDVFVISCGLEMRGCDSNTLKRSSKDAGHVINLSCCTELSSVTKVTV